MKRLLFACILLALASFSFTYKTGRTITGRIRDEQNNIVPFATVTAKGTHNSVSADVNASFKITVDNKTKTLEVTAVGFQPEEIQLTNAINYNVVIRRNTASINDVVVTTALGVQRAPLLIGNSNLQGNAAGIRIRGITSSKYSPPQIIADEDKEDTDDSWRYNNDFNTEGYDHIVENPFLKVNDNPLSTFSIDVDAASYANVRRFINEGELPPAGAVRIEELINYFSYNYPQPQNDDPFSINTEISTCPWNAKHKLVLIGLQGKKLSTENLPPSNLVFLIDVSGSMDEPDKLPLVKSSLKLLVDQLRPQDKVALVYMQAMQV